MEEDIKMQDLQLTAVIGFKGNVVDGLILHPDNEHLIYPLGSTIVVRHIISRTQQFLRGHDNDISVITASPTGKYIASGQKTFMGFQADVIIWDFTTLSLLHRLKLHKVLVQSLSFSHNELYLASLGGEDDKRLVIWEVATGKGLCGNSAGTDVVNQVRFYNNSDDQLITVRNQGANLWKVDYINKKISPTEINLGSMKRQITNVIIDPTDTVAYGCTKTGDILEINLEKALFKRVGPVKKLFSLGVTCIALLLNGDIVVGCGDGTIAKIGGKDMQIKAQAKLMGGVTSLTLTADGTYFFAGTSLCNIYWCDTDKLTPELRNTCHYEAINHVVFPYNYSDVFATCSMNDIRVWNAKNRQELLRIQVPNIECHTISFMQDGKSIVSGWSDGQIRAFLPQSGKLLYVINNAHMHGTTAIATTASSTRIISGGMEGEVRVWKIGKQTQVMEASLKEHRGRVFDIQVSKNNEQAVSASADGSCIIWDLVNFTRTMCLFEKTMFKQVLYHPDEAQVITTGSDRKIAYWDTYDGQQIRDIEASEGEINALAFINHDYFLSGGEDKMLMLWKYDEGLVYYRGLGHAGHIRKIAVSPNKKFVITVGSEGAILFWNIPEEITAPKSEIGATP